jgi:sterol desaturase/sphingolipid hydroxylase (fatty acid hydroxylase superfamily)
MSKSKKQRKLAARSAAEARRLTPGKLLRLLLKTLVFALLVSLLVTLLASLGIPVFESLWTQLAVMLVVYLLAYPYLMSEFRPRRVPPTER